MKKIMKTSGISKLIAIHTNDCDVGIRASAVPSKAMRMSPACIPPAELPNKRLVTNPATKAELIRPTEVDKIAKIDAARAGKVKLSSR